MKISELIEELNRLKDEHGDLEVYRNDYYGPVLIEFIDMDEIREIDIIVID